MSNKQEILKEEKMEMEALIKDIIAELEKGTIPWRRPWTDFSRYVVIGSMRYSSNLWPSNVRAPLSPYGMKNGIKLLMEAKMQGHKTNLWIPQRTVKELELTLTDSKSIGITSHISESRSVVYNIEQIQNYETALGVSYKTVKNRVDEDSEPHRYKESQQAFKHLKDKTGLKIAHGSESAFYSPMEDSIAMPDIDQFNANNSKEGEGCYWATLWHEIVHWTGHDTRLNRAMSGTFGDKDYAIEELIAELGATFLCSRFQINGEMQHASYIDSWIKLFKERKYDVLNHAGEDAQQATRYVLGKKNPK